MLSTQFATSAAIIGSCGFDQPNLGTVSPKFSLMFQIEINGILKSSFKYVTIIFIKSTLSFPLKVYWGTALKILLSVEEVWILKLI